MTKTFSTFLIFMLILGLIDMLTFFFKKKTHRDFKSIIISIGAFGTFWGISLGLQNFNSTQISDSIPPLLDGLKTAFSTSMAGMFISISISIIQKLMGHGAIEDELAIQNKNSNFLKNIDKNLTVNNESLKQSITDNIKKVTEKLILSFEKNSENISNNIIEVKNEISENIDKNTEILKNSTFENLQKSVNELNSSFEKNSENISNRIIEVKNEINESQIKISENMQKSANELNSSFEKFSNNMINSTAENHSKMTTFLKTNLDEVNKILKETTKILAKGATEEIINALKKVITDFNSNLTEQFGDSFKKLNEAVFKLVDWQDKNKEQTKIMSDAIKISSDNMTKITKTLDNMSDNYKKIDLTHNNLKNIITTNDKQLKDLEVHLVKLSEIGEKSKLMIDSIDNFSDKIKGSLTNQSETLNQLMEDSTKMRKEIEKQLPYSLGELNKNLTSLTNKFKDDYSAFLNHMSKIVNYN